MAGPPRGTLTRARQEAAVRARALPGRQGGLGRRDRRMAVIHRLRVRVAAPAIAMGALLLVAACGGGDDDPAPARDAAATAPPSVATATSTPTPSPEATGSESTDGETDEEGAYLGAQGADSLAQELVINGRTVVMWEIVGKDSIPAIFEPEFISADEANEILDDDDLVIGVSINGESHAYGISFLSSHEIVNDVVGGRPIAVTW